METQKLSDRIIEERTLEPGDSAQFGHAFNAITQRPRLAIRIEVPQHVLNQVEVVPKLLGRPEEPEKAHFVFSVRNRSSWSAFVRFVEVLDD